jgi:cytochrome d ubiquinol oxidase subunit I
MELHWNTNPQGEGAPLHLIAVPNKEGTDNAYALDMPNALSILTTHDARGTVQGSNDFPLDTRPGVGDATMMFYSFRLMIIIGFFLVFLVLISLWYWKKGILSESRLANHRFFIFMWLTAIPLGFIASEAGWMVREIGRQPWMIYHLLQVSDSVSVGLDPRIVGGILVAIILLYLTLGGLLIFFTRKTILKGPALEHSHS